MIDERDARVLSELIFRYGSCLDRRDWAGLDAVFAADLDATFAGDRFTSRDACVARLASVINSSGGTYHLFANLIIDDRDDKQVVVECYSRSDQVGQGAKATARYEVLSRYRFVARRAGRGWELAKLEMTPVFDFGDPGVFDGANNPD